MSDALREEDTGDLYFLQAAIGPMQNFVYLIGSKRTRECLLVDPAWSTDALLKVAAEDDMKVIGALVTHYHPDHVGGAMGSFRVPSGIADLLAKAPSRIHVNKHEAEGLKVITGVSDSDLALHEHDDVIQVGDVAIRLLHTPGHTPGSQCFLVHGKLVTGDTLFINGCGRVDLPGGNGAELQRSLKRLSELPGDVIVHPGHDYGAEPIASLDELARSNDMYMSALGR